MLGCAGGGIANKRTWMPKSPRTTSPTTHQRTFRKCAHLANPQHHPLPCRPAESRSTQRSGAATNTAELGGRVMGDRTGKQANKEQTCATHFFSGNWSSTSESGINRLTVRWQKQRTYTGPCRTGGQRVPRGSKMVQCCIFTVNGGAAGCFGRGGAVLNFSLY